MGLLFTNIKQLVGTFNPAKPLRGNELANLQSIHESFLFVKEGLIKDFGTMESLIHTNYSIEKVIDLSGKIVLPCWCDSHTHIVFAGSREDEFVGKIKGLSYAEIAAGGGGILNSARKLRAISDDDLYQQSANRLKELIHLGTGAIEIKSGYGLSTEAELKMLRVIKKLKNDFPIPIKATFLGAHSFPEEYKNNRTAYIDLIINEMIPAVAAEQLAEYIDVFCEEGFFSQEETERICNAGIKAGMKPKIHANQLSLSGGVQAAVNVNAISADHLETMDEEAIELLASSNTIGTLLPTAAYFLRMPFQPARKLIEKGCAIALASDFNPGSSPSGNMNLVVSMSCIQMKMLPEEAVNAATINGAFAMEVNKTHGSISKDKAANFIVTKIIPSFYFMPYSFGTNHIESVYINGEIFQ